MLIERSMLLPFGGGEYRAVDSTPTTCSANVLEKTRIADIYLAPQRTIVQTFIWVSEACTKVGGRRETNHSTRLLDLIVVQRSVCPDVNALRNGEGSIGRGIARRSNQGGTS